MRNVFFFASIIIITLFILSCKANKKAYCNQFKTGSFLLNLKMEQETVPYVINRNDSIQFEVNLQTGDSTKLSIKWTGPCTYELKFLESNLLLPDSLQRLRENMIIKTEIVATTSQYYLFNTTSDQYGFILNDTIWLKN